MNDPVNCFILAAGLGERLRPITNHIPKPLIPIAGRPVLQAVLEKVSRLSVNGIGINLHYKKEMIEDWMRGSEFREKVLFFPEDPILDTGGALKNAEGFLRNGTFLVHNSDIVSDMDLGKLLAFHLSSGNLATLAVHDCPRFNHVAVDCKGFLKGVGKGYALKRDEERWVAFTGIAVYSPGFLEFLPEGKSSVVSAWLCAAENGRKVGTMDVSGCSWDDIGSPAAYASAVLDALRAEGESVYIHPEAHGCARAKLDGLISLESGSVLGPGVSLRNCIVLPGGRVTPPIPPLPREGIGGVYENCILGPGFRIDLSEADMHRQEQDGAVLIGAGGSDRRYYRMEGAGGAEVHMRCVQGDPDYARHIEYTRFFLNYGVPVPALREALPGELRAVFEDLGDISLYRWLKCPRDGASVERVYERVLDALVALHAVATSHVAECPMLGERTFDYEHLRWETGYFIERFVEGALGVKVKNPSALEEEFHRLATRVDSFPKTIVHRDFQSQNIMLVNDGVPRVIDFQGARIGPPAYDIASMLWDPYHRLDDAMRERLLRRYIDKMKAASEFDEVFFREALLPCRLQRHMQALGAYGFLSSVKGRKYFLKHVPEALRLLGEEISLARNDYPELYALVKGL
ncbi:MAG TPA: phosphotransferase [Dissulfurispiraceae bacterium]